MPRMHRSRLLPALALLLCAAPCLAGNYRVAARLPTGLGPGPLALSPDGKRAVVCNSDSGDLSVFALPELTAREPIVVGRVPVAVTFDGAGKALVACFRDKTLARVDLDSGEVLGRVNVGDGPRDVALTEGGLALVPGYYDGVLSIVDPATMAAPRQLKLEVGTSQVITVPGSKQTLILNTSTDRVHVVDPAGGAPGLLDEKLGYGLWEAKRTPDGKRVLVTGWGSNTLAVLTANPAMSWALIPLSGKGACGLAITPDSRFAFVAHSESDTLVKVDLEALKEVGSVATGRFPFSDVAVSPDGADVLVTNDKAGTVSVIDTATLAVRQTLAVGEVPRKIVFAGPRALIPCAFANFMAVLEPTR